MPDILDELTSFHESQFQDSTELQAPLFKGARIHKGFVFQTPELDALACTLEQGEFDDKVTKTIFDELAANLREEQNVVLIQKRSHRRNGRLVRKDFRCQQTSEYVMFPICANLQEVT